MPSAATDTKSQLLWTAKRTCQELGDISARTLYAMTAPRGDLACVRLGPSGRLIRYDADVVRQYVKDRAGVKSAG